MDDLNDDNENGNEMYSISDMLMHWDDEFEMPDTLNTLLDFFGRNGVTRPRQLNNFDPEKLWEKREDCHLLQSAEFCIRLGDLCHSHALELKFGATEVAPPGEVYNLITEKIHTYYKLRIDPAYRLAVLPGNIDTLSYYASRTLLKDWFKDASLIEMLQQNPGTKSEWLTNGAILLLERHPLLSASLYPIPGFDDLHPFAFFLFGGFDEDILRRVHVFYPDASDSFDQHLPKLNSLVQEHHTTIPLQVIRNMLKMAQRPGEMKVCDGLLSETLLSIGDSPEVLDYARTYLCKEVEVLCVGAEYVGDQPWDLDLGKIRVIESLLPNLVELQLEIVQWTPAAFLHLCECFTFCEHKKLAMLRMHLPAAMAEFTKEPIQALQHFFQHKGEHLRIVSFTGNGTYRAAISYEQTLLVEATFEAISRGIQGMQSNWNLEQMNLSNFVFFDSNAIPALFSLDFIDGLGIQYDHEIEYEHSPEWDSIGHDDVRVEQMNFIDTHFCPKTWIKMWNCISRLTRLEKFMFMPGNTTIDRLESGPFDALLSLSSLKAICIGCHFNDDSIDITACLVALLGRGCLEFLQIKGSADNSQRGQYSYKVKTENLCQTLQNNVTLRSLFLQGVELEGTQVTKSFFNVLQKHNNTTLEIAEIFDDYHFYTIKEELKNTVRVHTSYESYFHAWQIDFLTRFNRFGRGKVQNKSTTLEDLLKLLAAVHPNASLEPEEKAVYSQILEMATLAADENQKGRCLLNHCELYYLLRGSPELFFNIVKLDEQGLNLRYGLLREIPGLWCARGPLGTRLKRNRTECLTN